MIKIYSSVLALLLVNSVAALAGPVEDRARVEAANEQYGKIFDYYMEICGVTQYRPRTGEAGGEYGHTVMYIKGACRDTSVAYPKIKVCSSSDPEQGTALSMDSDYTNVNWTTVGSRNFMMYGDLPADSPLSQKEFDVAVQKAVDQHIFKNVKLQAYHNEKLRRGESYEHYVARWGVGTNFAVNFARNAYCTKVPLMSNKGPKDAMVRSLVDYYNGLNLKAMRDGTGYSGVTNNCTHLAHNGLAAIGFWPAKETGWEDPAGFAWLSDHTKNNISVPFNTMLDALVKGGGSSDTFDPSRLAGAATERKGFYKYNWMGSQPGVIMEVIPIHAVKNQVYLPGASPFLLDPHAALMSKMNFSAKNEEMDRFERTIKEPRFLDLKSNFKYWQKKYANDARAGFSRDGNYPDLAPTLSSYLRNQQSDLAAKTKELQDLENPAPAPAAAEAPAAAKPAN
jgi:hypothetical protein